MQIIDTGGHLEAEDLRHLGAFHLIDIFTGHYWSLLSFVGANVLGQLLISNQAKDVPAPKY